MGIEDRQGKKSLEEHTSRPSENRTGGTAPSGKTDSDAAVKDQQQKTRDAIRKTLEK